MRRRIVVTGGAGFVGRALVRALVARGDEVHVFDRRDAGLAGARHTTIDLGRDAVPAEVLAGADAVFHLAALLPLANAGRGFHRVNVEVTERVCAAAARAGVPSFVHLSSSIVYGVPSPHPMREDHPLAPVGDYGESKRDAEARALARDGASFAVAVLRPRFIVGAGRLGLLTILFRWIQRGRRIPILGDGRNRFQMLAVDDLVDAMLRAADRRARGVFNVAAEPVPAVGALLESLIAHAGSRARLLRLPAAPAARALSWLDALGVSPLGREHYLIASRDYLLDVARARAVLGWAPRTTMEAAMASAYDHWRDHCAGRPSDGSAEFPHERLVGLVGRFL